jgi:hypothetical protein
VLTVEGQAAHGIVTHMPRARLSPAARGPGRRVVTARAAHVQDEARHVTFQGPGQSLWVSPLQAPGNGFLGLHAPAASRRSAVSGAWLEHRSHRAPAGRGGQRDRLLFRAGLRIGELVADGTWMRDAAWQAPTHAAARLGAGPGDGQSRPRSGRDLSAWEQLRTLASGAA